MSNIQGNEPASTEKSQAEKDDDEYWSDCDAETSDFQHNQLLYIVSHSSLDHTSFPKFICIASGINRAWYL